MNVLEKILEEIIDELKEEGIITDNERGNRASEIIRSHMDDIPNANTSNKRLIDANALDEEVGKFFLAITGNPKQTTVVRECKESFRRMIEEQQTVYVNDDWIPCSKRLPNEEELAKVYVSEDTAEFLVTIEGATRPTTLYFENGEWFDDEIRPYKVVAWRPLPEPYRATDDSKPDWKEHMLNTFLAEH